MIDRAIAPVLLLGASVTLYALATNIGWMLGHLRTGPVARAVRVFQRTSLRAIPDTLVRAAYFVGPPYAALIYGLLSPRPLGLATSDWPGAVGQASLLGLASLALFGLTWTYYTRSARALYPRARSFPADWRHLSQPWGWAMLLVDAIFLEAHWAFYRAVPVQVLGDVYRGTFLGLALVLLEATTSPFVRAALTEPGQAQQVLLRAGLAVVAALVFLLTGNLWLCLAVHVVVLLGVVTWVGE